MNQVYIALGSNLNNPENQLLQALKKLKQHPELQLMQVSSFYQSTALVWDNAAPQNDYINAVACLKTRLAPLQLLQQLQEIEQQQGRERGKKWAPRTLDLDILLYNDWQIQLPQLTIPHPEMSKRNFVILPLAELDRHLSIPGYGRIDTLVDSLADTGLKKLYALQPQQL